MEQTQEKLTPSGCLKLVGITIGLSIAMLVLFLAVTDSDRVAESTPRKSWDSLNIEERRIRLEEVISDEEDDLMILQRYVINGIKNKFNYPEEVEFDYEGSPNFSSNIMISDAQNGWLYAHGTGTAKNAFGVKSRFKWNTTLIYTDSIRTVKELIVFE